MNKVELWLEPVRFLASPRFLSGSKNANFDTSVEIITDLDKALSLAFEQSVPDQYLIWQDFFEVINSELRNNKTFDEARRAVDAESLAAQKSIKLKNIEYRKKKIKGINTACDDVKNGEIMDDASSRLASIAMHRIIFGLQDSSIFERIFEIYKHGLWPCGVKADRKTLIAFNPVVCIAEN